MSQIEYLIPLVSIIVGLGLADLIQSFRELVRPNRAVRWHWLPVLWSAIVFLLVLRQKPERSHQTHRRAQCVYMQRMRQALR